MRTQVCFRSQCHHSSHHAFRRVPFFRFGLTFQFTYKVVILFKSTDHVASPRLQSSVLSVSRSHMPSQRAPIVLSAPTYIVSFSTSF